MDLENFKNQEKEIPFNLDQLRKVIPTTCFKRDLARSLYFAVQDFVLVAALYLLAYLYYDSFWSIYGFFLFPLWWFAQGTMFWALFTIGHDCGHQSFSNSTFINYLVGHIAHTPILVPFHSWRISHHKHHLNTGSIEHDESFVAVPKSKYKKMAWYIWIFRYHLFTLGWTPYLIASTPLGYISHLSPYFKQKLDSEQEQQLKISALWIFCFIFGILLPIYSHMGFSFLFIYYFIPILIFGGWISIVTLLHHTNPTVPWYRKSQWNFLRGALSTVDRNYGILEKIHHDIGTHIVHHLFMSIPHYKLEEATKHIKPILGKYYRKDEESVFTTLYNVWKNCHYVNDIQEKVYFEKSPVFPLKEN